MKSVITYLSFLIFFQVSSGTTSHGQASSPQERLHLHSDKNFYLAGEIIWFRIHVVDGTTNVPVNVSKLAYTEILDRNNKPLLQAKIALSEDGGSGSFFIPLNMSSDHYILRSYTNWMKNEGSPAFFEKKITIINTMKLTSPAPAGDQPKPETVTTKEVQVPVTGTVQLKTDKAVYNKRQSVDISVLLNERLEKEGVSYSVAVYQVDPLQEADQGWQRTRKPDGKRTGAFMFLPEYYGHFITGRVINKITGNAVANANCLLTVPSIPPALYNAISDSIGIVRFEVKDYYGPGDIIAQVEGPDKYRVEFFSPFSDEPAVMKLPAFVLSPEDSSWVLQKSIAMQAQNIYNADSIRRFAVLELADTLPFYGKAEFIYKLDDYKRFTTMEEVLREYVAPINVVVVNGKLQMSFYDYTTQQVYRENLLILLDGVPLADFNKIFTIDPLKIRKLSVIPGRFILGSQLYYGVASFDTYNGKFDGYELDPSLIGVDYEGMQLEREFYSPAYDNVSVKSKKPDMRTTLYWKPEADKSSIQFYTSDIKGKFVVVLKGFSKNGEPVFGSTMFEVK